jgi:MoxR-like ATPase
LTGIVNQTTEAWEPVLDEKADVRTILEMRKMVRQVPIASHVKDYAVRIVLATHPNSEYAPAQTADYVRYGASPRGAQTLVLAAKVRALLEGRFNVALEDVRFVAKPALRHRIILNLKGEAEGIDTGDIVDAILDSVPDRSGK